jgi:PAS domain S-box-containing protein
VSRNGRADREPRIGRKSTTASGHLGVIRVVVVSAGHALRAEPPVAGGESVEALPPAMAADTTASLARLGDPVEILRAETPDALASALRDPSVDLVLVDRCDPDATASLLAAVPESGPPSVVVVEGDDEEVALAAFHAGASDCVHHGPEYQQVLPVVLLEQVQGWRAARQRRVSEHRIRWLEELYAAIVAEMPAALAVIDPDGLIVAVNPEFERLFPRRSDAGEGGEEFLAARLPRDLMAAVDLAQQPAEVAPLATQNGRAVQLVRVEEEGGNARAFEIRRRPLDAAGRVLLLISDVTESEWLSERLEALRRDHRDIIENVNSALLVVDAAGRISFANPAAERILGGEAGDLGGRHVGDWFAAPWDTGGEQASATSPIEECLAHGMRCRGAETLLRRADGQWIPVGISCSPRLDAIGRSRGAVAVFQDLSEIKELELQVRQTEKMASIGQLAAGVAHEVNNPMGFIHANLHQMSEYLADLGRVFEAVTRLQTAANEGDLAHVRSAAQGLETVSREIDLDFVRSDFEKALLESIEGAERIRHIVKDLRDFSRPDLPARSPADVNQALDSTANIVWTMMKHRVELEKDYGELPEIEAYPMQLKQVFMNLLVNAYQAIEAGNDDAPGIIRIETALDEEEVVVRIADTGVGIAAADRTRIFEPFFTTKPVGAGTGLGLSTCFNIVERHGGRLGVQSEVGRGTTFEVRLPIREAKGERSHDE